MELVAKVNDYVYELCYQDDWLLVCNSVFHDKNLVFMMISVGLEKILYQEQVVVLVLVVFAAVKVICFLQLQLMIVWQHDVLNFLIDCSAVVYQLKIKIDCFLKANSLQVVGFVLLKYCFHSCFGKLFTVVAVFKMMKTDFVSHNRIDLLVLFTTNN